MRQAILFVATGALLWRLQPSQAYITCATGEFCPDGNTCCDSCTTSHTTCITGHNASFGSCCMDVEAGKTGCGMGFKCDSNKDRYFCSRTSDDPDMPDILPRYKLCSLPSESFTQVHGLQVASNASAPQLAYLS